MTNEVFLYRILFPLGIVVMTIACCWLAVRWCRRRRALRAIERLRAAEGRQQQWQHLKRMESGLGGPEDARMKEILRRRDRGNKP